MKKIFTCLLLFPLFLNELPAQSWIVVGAKAFSDGEAFDQHIFSKENYRSLNETCPEISLIFPGRFTILTN